MRSGDRRMLEEINRVVCDSVSDIHFVYHKNYKQKLLKENIPSKNVHVVGNTIVEVIKKESFPPKTSEHILVDIHRPENFLDKNRMENLLSYLKYYKDMGVPVLFLEFPRTVKKLIEHQLYEKYKQICIMLPLQTFAEYLRMCRRSCFLVSDSGTGQEEPALIDVPVIVPRDYTERPESMQNYCSIMLDINRPFCNKQNNKINKFLKFYLKKKKTSWMGTGNTSDKIIQVLKKL